MTLADLVTRALRLAGVVGNNRAASSEEMNEGISTLNEMIASWALDGMDLGLAEMVLGEDVLVDDAYIKGLRYNLAVELANEHGIAAELPAYVVQSAEDQKDKIRAALIDVDNLRIDDALIGRRYSFNHTTGQ